MKRLHDIRNRGWRRSLRQFLALGLAAAALLLAAGAVGQTSVYAPTVAWEWPGIDGNYATGVPATFTVNFSGQDADGESGLPTHVRFMFRSAEALDGTVINSRTRYLQYMDEMIDFADPAWTQWMPYSAEAQQRAITFPDQPDQEYFLLAIQAMDTLGVVSLDREYGAQVFNVQIRDGFFRPELTVAETFLGITDQDSQAEIAAGQPLSFSWSGSADAYNGTIVAYRHGFDIADPDDPNDPGWAVPPGLEPTNLYAEKRTFNEGVHTFIVRVEDNQGQMRQLQWTLTVIPFVSPEFQKPLLFVDQVMDEFSQAWPGPGGVVAYDNQDYREAFWQFLEGAEGVNNFDWDSDHVADTELLSLSDVVWYRTALINARMHSQQLLFQQFRPQNGEDRFVWLTPYQQMSGQVFLVGDRSMESFLEALPNYAVPVIFDNPQETLVVGGELFVTGFGDRVNPDGGTEPRGPLMYPFQAAGIAALDWSVPVGKYIYGSLALADQERRSPCAGIKGLVLDDQFKTNHLLGPGVLPDTMLTDALIDWQDDFAAGSDSLAAAFWFRGDEFVDFNISDNPAALAPQNCDDGPGGMCVEPMFQGLSRFDWLKQRRWAEGDSDWPHSQYSPGRLQEICGGEGLDGIMDPATITSRVNGRTFGYLSYKSVEDKPGSRADVYWGFDPYRFDHDQAKQAVRWVLDYFGVNLNR